MKPIGLALATTIWPGKCPKHGCHYISRGKLGKFCPECLNDQIEREKIELVKKGERDAVHDYMYHASLIDRKDLWQCSFDNFKYKPASLEAQCYQKAKSFAEAYAKNPKKKFNTIFFGKSGTGKTHLAISILNYVNDHSNQKCLFLSIPRLLQANRDWQADHTSSNWSQRFTQERVAEADLVVVDDLGAESASGDATNFVQSVIFTIYDSNQRIITTTNLSSDKIRSTYDNRILSRVEENAAGHVMNFSKLRDKRASLEQLER